MIGHRRRSRAVPPARDPVRKKVKIHTLVSTVPEPQRTLFGGTPSATAPVDARRHRGVPPPTPPPTPPPARSR
eukprot:2212184-Prymnesium_polylepis.1